MPHLYFGQADGPRILRYGEGFKLVDSAGASSIYKPRIELWDLGPAGPMGECVFRSIDVKLRHTLGYSVSIRPIVDSVPFTPQLFSSGPPVGGRTEELVELQAKLKVRGTDIAAVIELDSTFAVQDVVSVSASGMALRRVP